LPSTQVDPDVADVAPTDPVLTVYDERHLATYLRLLDANVENADWRDVARVVLQIDPAKEPRRARTAYETHLARAKWLSSHGCRRLLRKGRERPRRE
jgi:Uncharacterized conserved protein (DUF2285)